MRPSQLHVETHSYSAEDSDTAQCDNRESTTLERRVYVGLEVEIVLIILDHPEPKIGDDKRLEYDQNLDRIGSVSSCSLDMLARELPPDLEALDFESSSSIRPVRYGRIVPLELG